MPLPEVNKYAGAYRKALSENPDSMELNNSVAMCYLKLKLYDKATEAFERAMEDNFDNSETFFYAAICRLRGKKAFLAQRADIDKIEEYINAALMIEPKGIYYYFLACLMRYANTLRISLLAGGSANGFAGSSVRSPAEGYAVPSSPPNSIVTASG